MYTISPRFNLTSPGHFLSVYVYVEGGGSFTEKDAKRIASKLFDIAPGDIKIAEGTHYNFIIEEDKNE